MHGTQRAARCGTRVATEQNEASSEPNALHSLTHTIEPRYAFLHRPGRTPSPSACRAYRLQSDVCDDSLSQDAEPDAPLERGTAM
jgi:hypothetical protein